jgi:hypothetical protein
MVADVVIQLRRPLFRYLNRLTYPCPNPYPFKSICTFGLLL